MITFKVNETFDIVMFVIHKKYLSSLMKMLLARMSVCFFEKKKKKLSIVYNQTFQNNA